MWIVSSHLKCARTLPGKTIKRVTSLTWSATAMISNTISITMTMHQSIKAFYSKNNNKKMDSMWTLYVSRDYREPGVSVGIFATISYFC